MNEFQQLRDTLNESVLNNNFVKLTLSKPIKKSDGLPNVYVRLVKIKGAEMFQFTYHYNTNDKVQNYTITEAITEIEILLMDNFRAATLFTLTKDLLIFISKRKLVSYRENMASFKNKLPETHDKPKERLAEAGSYLHHLGITDKQGKVIHKMADKYRQINKYLEIIEGLLKSTRLPKHINIVDMGSGKGYLTFALYDYLVNQKKYSATVTGIELRKELVDYCNDVAEKSAFTKLSFVAQPIQEYDNNKIDILIALHACDTATDDAIYKGLSAKAELIICAPCCHKQIRQQVKGKEQESPLLKYGIFKERQFEMVTDTIRALILEKSNYNTKVFEFISNEHTRKNVMLVASKSIKKNDISKIDAKIAGLKDAYAIESHYLETLV
ncbi:SAM-dependent methyltransferase [Tenacibaculum finnmarkense genomovar ulcerans]|uniref:class I SAM-dependent methyltransferase n=1 Tax=Tenacibaculum finnmarkense TaxID=2781243 RepID=UPI001E31D199|nr:SAM-dependent methyltransferase [Tenacibaculum finnmarkense]MCD8400015.1 SAM-dependent methyltransferase [Tenacibaculum finnmarkense genomovar ulcerans]MCD8432624.1 SAM-dependent methyltransferase [Tenacibaculum finnmarkense genomovar ulcerans]MCG8236327.1 SAM-dependent methyltransferase [Tenacibaculum finnmarkense genomovar ulcerans]MCG8785378.1 SAM-dependent methyltransferase [Tenacibaculum finnmarkense]MCG8830473.1 SAM-dependent methyltransferase [Tenacibaculum finnmarkense]